MKRHFVRNGRLTWLSECILCSLVLLGLVGIPVLNIDLWLAIPVGVMAFLAGAVLMFEGRSTAIGLKAFTDDPLGWRKAKNTYVSDDDPAPEQREEKLP
jgi:hypothetical protein